MFNDFGEREEGRKRERDTETSMCERKTDWLPLEHDFARD